MAKKQPLPIALPVRLEIDDKHDARIVIDSKDARLATVFGLTAKPRPRSAAFRDGQARADYMVRAMNAYPVLLQGVMAASAVLLVDQSTPVHQNAKRHVVAALSAAGFGGPNERRWGWSADEEGILYTPLGRVRLEPEQDMSPEDRARLAGHIASAVTLLAQLGGAGL